MMRYIYIPAGRKLWFELAVELESVYGCEPVVWYGDERLLPLYKNKFGGCHFVEREGAFLPALHAGESLGRVLSSPDFHWVKDEAIKMLDRIDAHDLWGRKVREAFFYRQLLKACALVDSAQADFLLLSESPHDVLSYLIWRVCRIVGMPCLHFEAASIAPALVMVSACSSGLKKIPRASGVEEPGFETVLRCVRDYLRRFESGFQPTYMIAQKEKEAVHASFGRRFRDFLLRLYPVSLAVYREDMACKGGAALAARRLKLWGREKTDELRRAYAGKGRSDFWGQDFLYFPLHYEPERTTSPDGGVYYDQIRAVLELRARLPKSFLLVIKEHPSQHYKNMRGFKGREKSLYDLLEGIEGVLLASPEIPSSRLISSCRGLVTVTGTAALESVCSGRPALVLGNAWFLGAPGTYVENEFHRFMDACLEDRAGWGESVRDWIVAYFSKYAFFGCVNPSNENSFSSCEELLSSQSASPLACQIDFFLKDALVR